MVAEVRSMKSESSVGPAGNLGSGIARPRKRRRRRFLRTVGLPYLFLSPYLILFAIFFIIPLVYAFHLSLYVTRLVGGTTFAGSTNYTQVFQDSNFLEGVKRMFIFGIFQVPIMLGLALAFALILDGGSARFKTLFRLVYFLPYAIPSVVAALLWGYLYGKNFGLFAFLANWARLPAPDFLSDTGMLPSLANIVTWQWTGYNMVIIYAALKAIPPDIYDAAIVDGANGRQVARYVKIPLVLPAIMLTSIFSIIGTLQLFNEPQIMSTLAPGVIQDHYTPNLYAYNLAFTNQQYNYSAAVSFVLGTVAFVASYVFMLVVNSGRTE
jgi:multiple sugar transport system permease protein